MVGLLWIPALTTTPAVARVRRHRMEAAGLRTVTIHTFHRPSWTVLLLTIRGGRRLPATATPAAISGRRPCSTTGTRGTVAAGTTLRLPARPPGATSPAAADLTGSLSRVMTAAAARRRRPVAAAHRRRTTSDPDPAAPPRLLRSRRLTSAAAGRSCRCRCHRRLPSLTPARTPPCTTAARTTRLCARPRHLIFRFRCHRRATLEVMPRTSALPPRTAVPPTRRQLPTQLLLPLTIAAMPTPSPSRPLTAAPAGHQSLIRGRPHTHPPWISRARIASSMQLPLPPRLRQPSSQGAVARWEGGPAGRQRQRPRSIRAAAAPCRPASSSRAALSLPPRMTGCGCTATRRAALRAHTPCVTCASGWRL